MKILKLTQDWLVKLLPEGLPYPISTIISGSGGSGKPLIGFALVSDWLRSGGSVIFIALQYPEAKFVKASLNKIYNMNVDEYFDKIAYIQFNNNIRFPGKYCKKYIGCQFIKAGLMGRVCK